MEGREIDSAPDGDGRAPESAEDYGAREPEMRILLVEDNLGDARLLQELLRESPPAPGYTITTAGTLAEARRLLDAASFAVILLDLSLPDSHGISTVDEILALVPETPLVVLTGLEDEAVATQAVNRGAQDFLNKGMVDPGLLARSIRYAVERKRREVIQRRAEEEAALLQAVALAVGEAADLDTAVQGVLARVCSVTEWILAEAWLPATEGDVLYRAVSYYADDDRLQQFDEESRYLRPARGQGLPGRVWEAGATHWIRDVTRESNFLRSRLAAEIGVRTAIGVPVLSGAEVVAVLTFFHRELRPVEDRLVNLVTAVAAQLGNLILRKRAEEALREMFEKERSAREEAEAATRRRDEVLSIVAHDLRNPLSAITMNAFLLLEAEQLDEWSSGRVDTISRVSQRMDRLIQDLLDVSRLEAGRIAMDPKPVAVEPLLSEALEVVENAAVERGILLSQEIGEGVAGVVADRDRALQALTNLLGNAVKFTPRGGRITLSAAQDGDGVRIRVADTGVGIAPEHLPHLFDRFWQANRKAKGGAGLGLAITKAIVEALGGEVGVESDPGSGSVFWFTLPAAPMEAVVDAPEPRAVKPSLYRLDEDEEKGGGRAAAAAGSVPSLAKGAEEAGQATAEPIRVIVVDDHAAIRRGLTELLQMRPDVVVIGEASSGEEAIARVKELGPDVVVMDLAMPGMGGIAAIEEISALDSGVRVLALTSDTEEESLLPVLQAGGCGYIRKTTAPQDLVEAIATVARGEVFLYPTAAKLLLEKYRTAAEQEEALAALSEQERDILALAAEGYTSREIGKKLFLSPKTVDTYRAQLMKNLGLSHRSELVRFALQTGLLTE
jgi:signal transduction histidine kinase/DNA-binding NarL/FixJ family response regulator